MFTLLSFRRFGLVNMCPTTTITTTLKRRSRWKKEQGGNDWRGILWERTTNEEAIHISSRVVSIQIAYSTDPADKPTPPPARQRLSRSHLTCAGTNLGLSSFGGGEGMLKLCDGCRRLRSGVNRKVLLRLPYAHDDADPSLDRGGALGS